MPNNILRVLENIITLGNADFFRGIGNETNDGVLRVAAGDPALSITKSVSECEIPATFGVDGKQMNGRDFDKYQVTGNSMLPKGILDGDYLLVKKNVTHDYGEGDFLIINVDRDYYKKYNPKNVIYDYKLRRALMRVTCEMSADQIAAKLKNMHFEMNIESNQKYMADKYKKARLAYPSDELMLSTTYHDGQICYSFHPIRLILGKAAILAHFDGVKLIYKLL